MGLAKQTRCFRKYERRGDVEQRWMSVSDSLLLCAALLVVGCGPACPSQPTGCYAGGEVSVTLPNDPALSAYSVSASADDQELGHCVLVAPNLEGEATWVGAECSGMRVEPVYESKCDSDCTPPPNVQCSSGCSVQVTHYRLVVAFGGQPKALTLTLQDSQQEHAPYEVVPQYETMYPDGPACGNGCPHAETTLALQDLISDPATNSGS